MRSPALEIKKKKKERGKKRFFRKAGIPHALGVPRESRTVGIQVRPDPKRKTLHRLPRGTEVCQHSYFCVESWDR